MTSDNPYQTPIPAGEASGLTRMADGALELHSVLNAEDHVAFNMHYLLEGAGRTSVRIRRYLPALVIFPLLGVLTNRLVHAEYPLVIALMVSFTWWFGWPALVRNGIRRQVAALFASGKNLLAYGDQWIAISPSEIRRRTPWCHLRVLWPAVERIVATDRHVFLYLSANAAFIVPLRDLPDEAAQAEFIETVRRFHREAETAAPVAAELF